jgi:hypothetical protein
MVGNVFRRGKKLVIQELNQRPELKGIPLMRRRGKKKEISRMPSQTLCQFIVLGHIGFIAGAGPGKVVGFVDYD